MPFLRGPTGGRRLKADHDLCVLFQKSSKHKKTKHKKEKEERSKDKKKSKKKKPPGDEAAEPVENGALDEEPLPVRGTSLASRGAPAARQGLDTGRHPSLGAASVGRRQWGLWARGCGGALGALGVREVALPCGWSP